MIDSHAHLDYPQLANDLPDILQRAEDVGVTHIITIGVKLSTCEAPKRISEKYKNVWFSVGIHPHEAGNEPNSCNAEAIRRAANHPKCVAIGETGLDYFYDFATPEKQAKSFRTQISVARETGLPIIVHSRDADIDMEQILTEEMQKGSFTGVMHCFSSGKNLAHSAVNLGFYVSFSGILTFKNSNELQEISSELPLDRILVETDSPYLAPVPHRGKRNEPAFTRHTLEKLAEIRGLPVQEMEAITRTNTLKLFSKMEIS